MLRDGNNAVGRTWDHIHKKWNLTRLGRQFYGERSDRWIAHIPMVRHLPRKNGTYYEKEDWLISTSLSEIGELSFSASLSEQEQRAEVRRVVDNYLAGKDELFDGAKVIEDTYGPRWTRAARSSTAARSPRCRPARRPRWRR